MKPIGLVLGAICALLSALVFSSAASAKIVNLYVYKGTYPNSSFNGSDAVGAEAFRSPANVAVDEETGDVYVGAESYIYHLNAEGVSEPFSSVSPNTVISQGTYGLGSLKVDNSGTATQGRIYAKEEYSNLSGYLPSGAAISPGFPIENLGDGCGMDVAPDGGIWVANYGGGIHRYDPSGVSSEEEIPTSSPCGFAIDAQENFYVPGYGGTTIKKYNRAGELLDEAWGGEGMGGENIAIDRSNGNVFVALYDHINEFNSSGELVGSFGRAEAGKSYPGLGSAEGIAVNSSTHEVYVGDTYGSWRVDTFVQTGPLTVPNVTTETPSVTPTTATLKGTVDPDVADGGTEITGCRFEWGKTTEYEHVVNCENPAPPLSEPTTVEATITGLTPSKIYHFRLTANNANGVQSNGGDISFQASGPPEISNEAASEVFSDGARLNAQVNPNGAKTQYHFEWGTAPCSSNPCTSVPVHDTDLREPVGVQTATYALTGLTPATTYYWRIVVKNANFPEVIGPDQQFKTFALTPPGADTCENALVRKQTGAALLPDCRAYELVSASNTGGYDVESNLYPGQSPLAGYSSASNPPRALYTVHFGAIPGIGDPPNFGDDPYVATRGANGWTTSYVGIPVTGTPDPEGFASTLIGADAGLNVYAFGGPKICDPCFADGTTGIPIRLSDGELVDGMQGSIAVPDPEPAGQVAKHFSADGSHFVFGSAQAFEPDGHAGEVAIYDRNLSTGKTHVVSKTPSGETMKEEGDVIGELDVSSDGSRILFGKVVREEGGTKFWHLYMNVGDSAQSIDVTPGAASGVLYDGMTADGTKVFFTTSDPLSGDGDTSADLYRADIGASSASVSRVSTGSGGTGDTDECTPTAEWNGAGAECGVVGIAGGGGVAAGDGTVYFLSPELLDGPSNGTAGDPNLFVVRPGGQPTYVATLGLEDPIVVNAVDQPATRSTEDFEISGNGDFAAFASRAPITGYATNGHFEVYRYDEPSDSLDCASCAPTGARAESDATLPHNGAGLTEDGRVFFTTGEPLNLRDLNGGKTDVYEWSGVEPKLVSTGTSQFDSALLSVSLDGKDAYFFTHDVLVSEDHNGNLVKLYDAREDGGFYVPQSIPPCRASDECHGPGTQSPQPPDIGTYKGSGGQVSPGPTPKKPVHCRGKRVRRHGRCVRKGRQRRQHRKHVASKRSHG